LRTKISSTFDWFGLKCFSLLEFPFCRHSERFAKQAVGHVRIIGSVLARVLVAQQNTRFVGYLTSKGDLFFFVFKAYGFDRLLEQHARLLVVLAKWIENALEHHTIAHLITRYKIRALCSSSLTSNCCYCYILSFDRLLELRVSFLVALVKRIDHVLEHHTTAQLISRY